MARWFKISVLCVALISLSACDNTAHYVLEADASQIGAGATITMVGKTGRIHMDPIQGYPKGLDEPVHEVERVDGVGVNTLKIETASKIDFTFSIGAGKYICTSCAFNKAPLNWHRVEPAKK